MVQYTSKSVQIMFGKIDYINLLPFHIHLKGLPLQNAFKKSLEYKKSFPSKINKKFLRRELDAAFISSIETSKKGIKTLDLGIVAKKNVQSVLVKKETISQNDPHSATSNILSKILKIDGKVIIGDRALKLFIDNPNDYIDLAEVWNKKYNLPFVFALLSVNRHLKFYKKISDNFKNKRIKIPQYVLAKYANERGISKKDIKRYLSLISYEVESSQRRGLKLFLKKAKSLTQI